MVIVLIQKVYQYFLLIILKKNKSNKTLIIIDTEDFQKLTIISNKERIEINKLNEIENKEKIKNIL